MSGRMIDLVVRFEDQVPSSSYFIKIKFGKCDTNGFGSLDETLTSLPGIVLNNAMSGGVAVWAGK